MGEHVGSSPDDRCQVEHLGIVISGRAAVSGPGYEAVMGPGDIFAVPPDHDSWVVGDEPLRLAAPPRRVELRGRVARRRDVRRSRHAMRPVRAKFKTQAVVLRSIRYGEADRVLHLYSATRGRIGAIAKGVRRPRSRFGGRLEPFFCLDLVLHQGRGDLATVTAAHGRSAPELARERSRARGRRPRLRRGPSPARLRGGEPGRLQPAVPLPRDPRRLRVCRRRHGDGAAGLATAIAFRLKLALAAGFAPSSPRAPAAARATGWRASREPRAGWSAAPAAASLSGEAHGFMVEALGPLAEAPAAGDRALRQTERAIAETLEHHAHVQLRAAA